MYIIKKIYFVEYTLFFTGLAHRRCMLSDGENYEVFCLGRFFFSSVSMDALLEIDIRMLDDDECYVFVHGPPTSVHTSAG